MPEWLSPRRDAEGGSWNVEEGAPVRGDAWTNLHDRMMRVPTGSDETTRTIRAHEMMHARVSPFDKNVACEALPGFPSRVIECAEEFRVNMLVKRAGFNIDNLVDGSESKTGKRIAESENWAEAACFLGAIAGTKGAADFLRGIRGVNADMAKALREVEKTLLKLEKTARRDLGSTEPDPERAGAPMGFTKWTGQFAEIIKAAVDSLSPDSDEDGDALPDDVEPAERLKESMKARSGTAGVFAPLVLDRSVALVNHVKGSLGRRRTPTNIGRNPRRIHRTLTDPERRIFDRTARGMGGIVVIDQSGSMSLEMSDIWEIVNTAPGCVIIGYSHPAGSVGTPNTWVIADRGKVAETFPRGGRGNGVDGPALRFALSKRRHGEPVIWVCDGLVTDGKQDMFYDNLADECANIVIRHGIHMVPDVSGVAEALVKVKRGERLKAAAIGHIASTQQWRAYGRELLSAV